MSCMISVSEYMSCVLNNTPISFCTFSFVLCQDDVQLVEDNNSMWHQSDLTRQKENDSLRRHWV